MPDINVNIGGNAAGVLAAVAEAQAALATLSRKTTCVVDFQVRGHKEAIAAFNEIQKAQKVIGGEPTRIGVDSAQVRKASDHVNRLGTALERTREHVVGFGEDAERSHGHIGTLGDRVEHLGRQSDVASGGLTRTNRQLATFNRHVERSAGLGDDVDRLTTRLGGLGVTVGGLGRGGAGVAAGLESGLPSLSGVAGPLGTAAQVGGLSAIGTGILVGGVGAIGAGSALGVAGAGAGLGLAGAGLTGFTIDTLTGTKQDPGPLKAQFDAVNAQIGKFEQDAVLPYGQALLRMADQGIKAAPAIVAPVKDAFGEIGRVAEGATPSMVKAAGLVADGFNAVTHGAAPAYESFFRNLPGLTEAVIPPAEQLARTFSSLIDDTFATGVPAFAGLARSAGDLGAEVLKVGADSFAPFEDDTASMVRGVTGMIKGLEPAIRPAMGAVTSVVNAATGAIGDPRTSKAITDASLKTQKDAPGLKDAGVGLALGTTAIGEAATGSVAGASPEIVHLGQTLQRDKGFLGAVGSGALGGAAWLADAFLSGASDQSPTRSGWASWFSMGKDSNLTNAVLGRTPADLTRATLSSTRTGTVGGPAQAVYGDLFAGQQHKLTGDLGPNIGGAMTGMDVVGRVIDQPVQAPAPPTPPAVQGAEPSLQQLYGQMGLVQSQAPATGSALQSMWSAITTGSQQAPAQTAQAMQQTHQAIQGANLGPAVQSQVQSIPQVITDARPLVQTATAELGASMNTGMVKGYERTQTVVDTLIRRHILNVVDIPAQILDSHSPSRVFMGYGESMPTGMALGWAGAAPGMMSTVVGGMSAVVDASQAIAGSSRTKQVGETWAQSVLDGATGIFRTDQLKNLTTPKIDNVFARAALGALGALGPAGSGALAAKTLTPVTGSLDGPGGQQIHVVVESHSYLDGEPVRAIARAETTAILGQVVESGSRQSG